MIELLGDVGSGKTTLTKGILEGLGYKGDVVSPTYTVSRTYPLSHDFILHHFDYYRLKGHDATTEEFAEATNDKNSITVVEWPGRVDISLPNRRLQVHIIAAEVENKREISVTSAHPDFNPHIERLKHDTSP